MKRKHTWTGRARTLPSQHSSEAWPGSFEKRRSCRCKETSLLAEQEEKGPSAAGAPSVSGSPAPRPVLTKVTVLSIVPVSEGLVELVVPQ